VLLEEVGHAIDDFLNFRDSARDEGAIALLAVNLGIKSRIKISGSLGILVKNV
jgi:hypothetical protein